MKGSIVIKNMSRIFSLVIALILITCVVLPAMASTEASDPNLVVNFVRTTSMTGNDMKPFGAITATGTGSARVGGLVQFTSTGSFSSPLATVDIEIGRTTDGVSLAKATISSPLSGPVPTKKYIFVGERFSFTKGWKCCYRATSTGFPSGLSAKYCGYVTSKSNVSYEEIEYGYKNGQ